MTTRIESSVSTRNNTTFLLFTIIPALLLISACSVISDQDLPTIEPTITEPEEIIELPHTHNEQGETLVIPRISPPQKLPPKIASYSVTKQAWEKHQPKLNHKQRFDGVLQAHNGVRKKHGLQPLKWSSKLAKYSQDWANSLGRGSHCQIRHRSGTPPFGENLYRSSALKWSDGTREVMAINIKEVVKSWTDEEKWYNHQRNSCQPGKKCGHYTQVVWRKTTEVGCAVKVCADKSQTWVCSYNPPGNWTGMRPY